MIRKPISLPENKPLTRTLAASFVQVANQFEARVMISRHQKIVNAKSTLGLLSLSADDLNDLVLIAEGADEEAAVAAILELLS
ncbi:MAG: HPr family phosphocarrier protein [Clostridia bacterium]|nr:HPr family phosphocarrier protein [Clostridia bacterium]